MPNALLSNAVASDSQWAPASEPVLGHGPYPLTHAQESLWCFEQLNPGTATYNLPEAFLLKGPLDRPAFQRSLNRLVARHESLRTQFRAEEGKPKQWILAEAEMPLDVYDLSQDAGGRAEANSWLRTEATRAFDLACAPLARATLFRLAPQEHLLLLNVHHIISDAWSQGVFIRELAEIYGSFVRGAHSTLEELPVQYADFVFWQREFLDSAFGTAQLEYWRKKFEKPPEPVLLPADFSRTRPRSTAGMTVFYEWPEALTDSLRELSRRHGVTVFMTLLAAFKALLHRYTGQDNLVVGSPMACRDRVELESLVGFFVHTQPIISDLSGDPSFSQLLKRVREAVLDAHTHQDVPCQLALQTRQTGSAPGTHPLFQVVFGWQSASPHNWRIGELEASKIELDTGTSKFDWTVLVTEYANRLYLRSEFSTDLFEPPTLERLMQQFRCLIESALLNPEERLTRLELETPGETAKQLVEWNRTESPYERECQIQEVFERQVEQRPEAVALCFAGRQMTYAVLNARANQLGHHLRELGVGNGTKVGLCLDRSFDLIIGMLGILKAGGAYVPLDPALPRERLELMFEDCGITMLVTKSEQLADFPWSGQTSICLDKLSCESSSGGEENLIPLGSSQSPAYVMYTSGSTGKAKGAVVPHRAVVRLVKNTNYMEFSPDQVFLQAAPVSFDASTFEIWGPLLNGARLVIMDQELPSLSQLGRVIKQERVDTLWLTSGLFQQMTDQQLEDLQGLKYLLAGGDVLSPAHVAKAVKHLPNCQLINGYGPTENTTFTCCYRVPKTWRPDQPVPIGRPISNTHVYVLDRDMTPVPIGIPGELYAGGDGLALEYLNRPDLNAQRFVPNPFDREHGSRLYRTGDLVRWRADGNLEFLARTDDQIKIRGHRVEPGEVEAVFMQHPSVGCCAVIAHDDEFIGKHLVAYVTARNAHDAPDPRELQDYAKQKLPTYVAPSQIILMEELPLTANGKVDRRALPFPSPLVSVVENQDAWPSTPLEESIAGIWCEVLGRSQVRTNENFFQLGGHSLLATQVISRISKTCGVELPVIAIFEAPTVAKLAKAVGDSKTRVDDHFGMLSKPGATLSGAARAAELLSHLDEFTEAELEELLRDPDLKNVL